MRNYLYHNLEMEKPNPCLEQMVADPFYRRIGEDLKRRKAQNRWREIKPWLPPRIDLSSNDYLNLRSDPAVLAGAHQAMEDYGSGSGASPLLFGFLPCHQELLDDLLRWKNKPAGMLFNSGFMANQALVRHLPGPNDLILADRLIHHSIAQALTQSRAAFKRYDHLDLAHLEELLEKKSGRYETVFVITETVFSMDGDYPDLKSLVNLKNKFPFILILDEAHATGVYGPTGGGLAEEAGVLEQVDILVGTLGKSLASMGAYILASIPPVIDYLINFSGEFIYSTFMAPSQAGAARAAIGVVQSANDKRVRLKVDSIWFREQLAEMGWERDAFDSPIIPIHFADEREAIKIGNALLEKGIQTGIVRPPTVPEGTARLRLSLHSGVDRPDLKTVLEVLKSWRK